MGFHLKSPNGHPVVKTVSVSVYAQEGKEYEFKLGRGKRNKLRVTSQRFIVLKVEHDDTRDDTHIQCEFSIEERWTDYSNGPSAYSRNCTAMLANKTLHYYWNNSDMTHEQYLLFRAFNTAPPSLAEDIFYKLFYGLILNQEIKKYLEEVDRKPGFLETWVPEYLESHAKIVLRARERDVAEVHNA